MYCVKCGRPIEEGSTFCGECGTKVEAGNNRNRISAEQTDRRDTRRTYRPASRPGVNPVIVGMVCLCIVMGGIVAYLLLRDNNAAERQIASAQNGGEPAEGNNPFEAYGDGREGEAPQETGQNVEDIVQGIVDEKLDKKDMEEIIERKVAEELEKRNANSQPPAGNNHSSYSDEYLFPSNREYITVGYLSGLTRGEIGLIRNEIYARHGYIFSTKEYRDYFSSKSWYVPNKNFDSSWLSAIEQENVKTITAYEKQMGWR